LAQGNKLVELEASAQGEGPVADAVRKQLDEERPKLSTYERDVWEAFWFLGTSRINGMGVGGIPFPVIRDYVEWSEMPRVMSELFIIQINLMDRVYVSAKNTEAARSSK
jgi:hypothetical protein